MAADANNPAAPAKKSRLVTIEIVEPQS